MDAKLKDLALKIAGEIEEKTGLYYQIDDDSNENEIIVQLKAKKFQVGRFSVFKKQTQCLISKRFGVAGEIEVMALLDSLERSA